MPEEPTPLNEKDISLSLSEIVENHQGILTLNEVNRLLELGVDALPPVEGGGKLHGSSEAENKNFRLNYIRENLGIEPDKIPHPINEGKFLPERLVADVLVDTVALCHTIDALQKAITNLGNSETNQVTIAELEKSIKLQLDIHNKETELRLLKGQALDHKILFDNKIITSRKIGQKHGYYPARNTDLERAGYLKNIYEALETALQTSQKPEE